MRSSQYVLMGNWVLGSICVFITSSPTAVGLERVCKENVLEINGPINLFCIVACRNINREKQEDLFKYKEQNTLNHKQGYS